MQHRTLIRAMLIGAAAFGAWTAAELADDHAAHAADKPPAVQQPGGVLDGGVRLPEQASDQAKAAVAKPKPKPPAKPKPPTQDAPAEPAPAPKPVDDKPSDKPKPPPAELPPVVNPRPVPAPKPPAQVPAPTRPAEAPAPLPPVEVPVELPVAIGPTPTVAPATAVMPIPLRVAALTEVPLCGHEHPADEQRATRDTIGLLIDSLTRGDTAEPPTTLARGCPGSPPPDHAAGHASTTASGGTQTGHDSAVSDVVRSHAPPVLARLEHARARSTIPAGRHTSIEPRPA